VITNNLEERRSKVLVLPSEWLPLAGIPLRPAESDNIPPLQIRQNFIRKLARGFKYDALKVPATPETGTKWPESMKACEAIEVMNNLKRQIRQEIKASNRARTSDSKVSRNGKNRSCQWFQSMKEYKLIQVMNNLKIQIPQELKRSNRIRMAGSKVFGSGKTSGRGLSPATKEYRSIQVMNMKQMQIHQPSKLYSRFRMSNKKAPKNHRNRIWKWSISMME
jgi:hypothetical protein